MSISCEPDLVRAYRQGCKRFKCRVLLTFYAVEQRFNYTRTVLARVSSPGWLSQELCKSGRGWLTQREVALLYIPLFLRGGWLKGNSVQRHGGGLHERVRYILYSKKIEKNFLVKKENSTSIMAYTFTFITILDMYRTRSCKPPSSCKPPPIS